MRKKYIRCCRVRNIEHTSASVKSICEPCDIFLSTYFQFSISHSPALIRFGCGISNRLVLAAKPHAVCTMYVSNIVLCKPTKSKYVVRNSFRIEFRIKFHGRQIEYSHHVWCEQCDRVWECENGNQLVYISIAYAPKTECQFLCWLQMDEIVTTCIYRFEILCRMWKSIEKCKQSIQIRRNAMNVNSLLPQTTSISNSFHFFLSPIFDGNINVSRRHHRRGKQRNVWFSVN